ncbi:hypothetical protein U1Q18_014513 [Sarracenia purpurea var. burkii]
MEVHMSRSQVGKGNENENENVEMDNNGSNIQEGDPSIMENFSDSPESTGWTRVCRRKKDVLLQQDEVGDEWLSRAYVRVVQEFAGMCYPAVWLFIFIAEKRAVQLASTSWAIEFCFFLLVIWA